MAVICPNCAGKLIFSPASQKLECARCGSSFRPEDVSDVYADAHSRYYDAKVYTCGHCGAEVISSDSEASTFCVYCGNPAINFTRVSKQLKPDGIIPFQITKENALDRIKEAFFKNPIIPKEVKEKAVPENLRGIYVPYWLVSCELTDASFLCGNVNTGEKFEERYYQRAGKCSFRNVPVDGSNIILDEVSRKLEPFYFEDAKDFDEDYLNGFYSNVSDMTYTDLRKAAGARCHELFASEACKTVDADGVEAIDARYWVDIQDDPLYLMMPVWFFTFMYNNEPHTVLVNGQTGKLVGTMHWEKKRIYALFWTVFLIVFAAVTALYISIAARPGGGAGVLPYALALGGIILVATVVFVSGFVGLKKISRNIKLTKSADMFKFVKRRQG